MGSPPGAGVPWCAEGLMTANKHFKRRVRERARRTGESYTAALVRLRQLDGKEQPVTWQRIGKPDFGYAVQVPADWDERPPDLGNSPWETARFGRPADHRHIMIVFRTPNPRGRGAEEIASEVRPVLEGSGFTDFRIGAALVGGRAAGLLECARHDAGRIWAVREYFVVQDDVRFCLALGSSVPEEAAPVFAEIVERFELLD
jgi:hypothetical protein